MPGDPRFGTNQEFKTLVQNFKAKDFKVVLDGVFNGIEALGEGADPKADVQRREVPAARPRQGGQDRARPGGRAHGHGGARPGQCIEQAGAVDIAAAERLVAEALVEQLKLAAVGKRTRRPVEAEDQAGAASVLNGILSDVHAVPRLSGRGDASLL